MHVAGGSYLITQRWIHDLKVPATTPVKQQEEFVGRTKDNSVQLNPLPTCSHVSRMVGADATGKKINIVRQVLMTLCDRVYDGTHKCPTLTSTSSLDDVRQSMPYGSLAADAGLFFIAYANSPANFNFMLDRMVGKSGDGLHDDILRFSKCVSGNFWYVDCECVRRFAWRAYDTTVMHSGMCHPYRSSRNWLDCLRYSIVVGLLFSAFVRIHFSSAA